MHVPVDYIGVISAAIASTILGFVWYGPLFGKQWVALSDMTVEKINATKASDMGKSYMIAFLGSIAMAYVLANIFVFVTAYFQSGNIVTGFMVGMWTWFGFVMPVTLGTVLWENKSWKLWILNNAYYLITLIIMGAIIALWR